MNPYLEQTHAALPGLFAQFDHDPFSPTRGVGDRFYWAWKLIDFANGTFQGFVHGLARLYKSGLLPDEFRAVFLKKLDDIFAGTDSIRRSNGSLEEAFPYESSFCVTALVAYDLLTAVEIAAEEIGAEGRRRYLAVVEPMIRFLHLADESHGFISNHLATAAAALYKWTFLTGQEGEERGLLFLKRILSRQSSEGWYQEYEGADPGYETLSLHYLADLHRLRPDLGLGESLKASIRFLWNFAHPDGSFGGYYGSRNTRFYYPSGICFLAREFPEAQALHCFMTEAIGRKSVVTLASMDPQNVVPMFNSYAWTAALHPALQGSNGDPRLPCNDARTWSKDFPQSGIHVRSSPSYYAVISSNKGGVVVHYDRPRNQITWDCGAIGEDRKGGLYSSQWYRTNPAVELSGDKIVLTSPLVKVNQMTPTPFDFLVLRILNLTVMRVSIISDLIKRFLVWLLITRKRRASAVVRREICFGENGDLSVSDTWANGNPAGYRLRSGGIFRSMYMASSGYWQRGDI